MTKEATQREVANAISDFLEMYKNNCISDLVSGDMDKKEILNIQKTMDNQLAITKSKAFEYVINLLK
jgi:hypothetical protein